ncbi:MAG: type ISP restriction/modification enzyme, partial [Ruminococcus sp.]|nr:type ISP restriction/modification enzyme [Ruminococcus sp.]
MKLAMVLKDTGYDFESDKRLNVLLTNSLEPSDSDASFMDGEQQLKMFEDPLAAEAWEADKAKNNQGINVIIGNPPYSGESANKGKWIMNLMEDYKKEPGGKEKLKERNPKWINDDYVKFIRYAQYCIEKSGQGIISFINPHGFIDNPTFRGMRWKLLSVFDKIYILDLHGNAKKKEICPDGSKDENVFDIQQGVSIIILVKSSDRSFFKLGKVFHFNLYGTRITKYTTLSNIRLCVEMFNSFTPVKDNFLFVEQSSELNNIWNECIDLEKLFKINGVGICSKRDNLAFQDSKEALLNILDDFVNLTENEIKIKYNVTSESRDQKVCYAKDNVITYGVYDKYLKQCLYRPFDMKWTYYTDKVRGFLAYPVYKVLGHMTNDNCGIIISRQGQASDLSNWNVVFIANSIVDLNIFRRGGGCLFPLYTYSKEMGKTVRTPNLNSEIVKKISEKLDLPFNPDSDGGETNSFAPIDLLDYIYAVLHSPKYRETYEEFLKIDFPRVPYPTDVDMFWKMVKLGGEIRKLHLMESLLLDNFITTYPVEGENEVVKPTYKNGRVNINKEQYFDGVPELAWNFYIGGYQPCQKWLKDRKGRQLTDEDIVHYQKIVVALTETDRLMKEIDKIFEF